MLKYLSRSMRKWSGSLKMDPTIRCAIIRGECESVKREDVRGMPEYAAEAGCATSNR
jgi:hypothetical protein